MSVGWYLEGIHICVDNSGGKFHFTAHFCFYLLREADGRIELTSKLTEPFLLVSKASNRKCAYILESAKVETHSNP